MKVLIIGLGSIAKKHITALKEIVPQPEVFALRSNKNSTITESVSNLYSYDEVQNQNFDFAIISNPTIKHKDTIDKLVQFKIPLFIEKPVHSSTDIAEQIKKIEKAKIKTYVACNLRFLETIQYLKEQLSTLKNKRLNEVNVYCGSYLPEWRPGTNFRENYSANVENGGGVHLDLIHELDYIYWFFGNPLEIRRFFSNQSGLNITAYDYANYLLKYEGFSVNIILNYFRRDAKRSIELVFNDETWFADLLKNDIRSKNDIIFASNQKVIDTYKLQMQYFINSLKNNTMPFNTIKEGYDVLKICLGNDTTK